MARIRLLTEGECLGAFPSLDVISFISRKSSLSLYFPPLLEHWAKTTPPPLKYHPRPRLGSRPHAILCLGPVNLFAKEILFRSSEFSTPVLVSINSTPQGRGDRILYAALMMSSKEEQE